MAGVVSSAPPAAGRPEQGSSAPGGSARPTGLAGGLSIIFASLKHRDYRFLWIGTLFMSAGQWIQQVTIGWLLYHLTGSAVLLGAINGARAVPFLITGPLAGVAADRMDRRKMMLVVEPLLMLTTFIMGMLVLSEHVEVWHLFVFTVVTATLWSINQPVRQSLVPNLVPKRDLLNALALNSLGFNSMKVLGPAIGGALIAAFGAGGNFLLQSAVYGGLLVMVYLMKAPPTPPDARKSSALSNLREGLAFVWESPLVLALITASLIPHMFSLPVTQALMPVFQKDVLEVGPEGLGLLLAAPGIGAVLATTMLAYISNRLRQKGVLLLGGLVMLGVFLVLFAQARSLQVAMLMLVGVGAFQMIYMTTANTVVQVIVPDHLRGRVMSIWMLDQGLGPAGALLAGVSTHFVGAPLTVTLMGAIVVTLALLLAWRVPRIRQIET